MRQAKEDNPALYNSRILKSFMKLMRKRHSDVNMDKVLAHAKVEHYQVEDESHWFTQEQVELFYGKLVELTGNKNLAREAGRYAASPEATGLMRHYILGCIGPSRAYEMVGKCASNFTRSSVYESRRTGPCEVEITVAPAKGIRERRFQCENRMGYFDAISSVFNCRQPGIDHPECLFDGGKVCRYIISWKASSSVFWKKIRNHAAVLLFGAFLAASFIHPVFALAAVLPMAVFLVLSLDFYAMRLQTRELNVAVDSLRDSTDKLMEQVNLSHETALMTNEISLALSRHRDIDGTLAEVVRIFRRRLDYDRGLILLANKDRTLLNFRAGFGYKGEQMELIGNVGFHLDRLDSRGVFVVSFREQRPFLINNLDEIRETLSPRSMDFIRRVGTKSFICCPIVYENEPVGIIAVDNVRTKRPLLQRDMNLLMGVASTLGISIHNAMLFEEKECQFKSILQVLAATIDARDPLTSGHSERVTEYATGICKEVGMPREFCEMIRVAALLHDYGKIAIRDSILKKESVLTTDEREEIMTHAGKTQNILEQINFEGIYREVPDVAGSHHERVNGSGYPRGLKGEAIPIGSRILAVADFFEAVTAKRHYRDPLPVAEAFRLLEERRGTEFDRNVVDAFISYYNRNSNMNSTMKQARPN